MKVDIYVASENLQPKRQDRWSGYIIRAEGSDREVAHADLTFSTAYQSVIMNIVAALDRFTRPAQITIHIDSNFVLGKVVRPIENGKEKPSVLEHWQENGWRTTRKTEVKNRNDWQRLYNKLRVFEQSGGSFAFKLLLLEDPMRDRILRTIRTEMAREE